MSISKYVLKRSISAVKMSQDWSTVEEVTDVILPAGCVVQEKSYSDESKQIVAECLEEFNGISRGLFVQAMEEDLIEISIFTLNLLLAEKQFPVRLIFCRDENWLEEARYIEKGSDVLVTYGAVQLRGVVRYMGVLHPHHPDKLHKEMWFGVALTHSNLQLLRQLVPDASDGSPHFECEDGRGLYVTICSIRLADVLLASPFQGSKPFSSRGRKTETLKAAQKSVVRKSFNVEPGWSQTFDVAGKRSAATVIDPFETNDRIVWKKNDNRYVRGTVRYIGNIQGCRKMALELDEPEGDKGFTGMVNSAAQFQVQPGYGIFVDEKLLVGQLMRESEFGYFEVPTKDNKAKEVEKPLAEPQEKQLNKGDRVVWYANDGMPVPGEVAFFGKVPEKKKDKALVERVGVILDEPKGEKNFEGKSADGKQLFKCKKGFGILVPVYELMSEEQFFATLSNDTSVAPASAVAQISKESQKEDIKKREVQVGDEIIWITTRGGDVISERGTVKYIGPVLEGKCGVEFKNPVGEPNWTGKRNKKQLFECKPGHGKAVAWDELIHVDEFKARMSSGQPLLSATLPPSTVVEKPQQPVQPAAPPKPSPDDLVTHHQAHGDFEIGDRVAVIESDKPEKSMIIGTLRWIGVAKRISNKIMYGVAADEQVGEAGIMVHDGIIGDMKSGYALAFDCKPGFGVFTEPKNVKKLKDLDIADPEDPKERPEIPFMVGDRVILLQDGYPTGTVRWKDVEGYYPVGSAVGVQLDKAFGDPSSPKYSGSIAHGTRSTSLNCNPGCGVFVACSELAPADDTQDAKNVVEADWTIVGKHGPVREPQHEVASDLPVTIELPRSPPQPSPSIAASSRPSLLPTPPPAVGHFEVKLLQRVFTYVNNQQVFGTVMWMNPATMEVGVQYDTFVRGAPGGMHYGVQLFNAMPGFGQVLPVQVLHPLEQFAVPPVPRPQFHPGTQPTPFPVGVPFQPMLGVRVPAPVSFPNALIFPPARPVNPAPVQSPPRPASRREVEEAIRQADEMEKALAERQTGAEIFRFQMEEDGVSCTIVAEDRTKGFVKFLPKTDEQYIVEHIAVGMVRTPRNTQFFPPFFLHFEIPHGYPDVPPVFRVDCNYVPAQSCLLLKDAVLARWHDCKRNASPSLLYDAVRAIRNNLLDFLGFPVCMTITGPNVYNSGFLENDTPGLCVYATDKEARDVFDRICRYNDRATKDFEKKMKDVEEQEKVECSVCADLVSPVELSDFSPHCQHLFCRGCITGHVRAQVDQGNTSAIRCPGEKCDVQTTLLELADVVDAEIFKEFSGKLLDQGLAGMNDIMRCPHCTHAVVFEPNMLPQNERYIKCPAEQCGKLYCPSCRGKDHGDQPCLTFEQKRELRNAYVNGTEEDKAKLEQQHGKDNIKHAIEDFDAEEIIRTQCKLCPHCKTPTQKNDGCNHLTCTRCHTHFCWLCGAQMSAQDPYSHFQNGRCDMYRQGPAAAAPDNMFRRRLFDQPRGAMGGPPRYLPGHRGGYRRGGYGHFDRPFQPREQRLEDMLQRLNGFNGDRGDGALGRRYGHADGADPILQRMREHQRERQQNDQLQEQAWLHPELYIFD